MSDSTAGTDGTDGTADPKPGGGGRPGGRLLRPVLVLAGLGWLALEVYLYWLVATTLGPLLTVLLLVVGAVAGTAVVRATVSRAARGFREQMEAVREAVEQAQAEGRDPAEAANRAATGSGREGRGGDTALTVTGGVLLAVPSFGTDALGLLLVLPPTRSLVRRGFGELAASRLVERTPFGRTMADARAAGEQWRIHRPGERVIRGEVIDDDPPPTRPDPDPDPGPPPAIGGRVITQDGDTIDPDDRSR